MENSIFFSDAIGEWLPRKGKTRAEEGMDKDFSDLGQPKQSIIEKEEDSIQKMFSVHLKEKTSKEKDVIAVPRNFTALATTWHCSSCTFLNTSSSDKCEVCQTVNKSRRKAVLKERQELQEQKDHALRAEKYKAECLNDLDDLDSSDDGEDESTGSDPPSNSAGGIGVMPPPLKRIKIGKATKDQCEIRRLDANDGCYIDILPNRALVHVFGFLATNISALHQLKLVKKYWERLASDSSLWKPIFITLRESGRLTSAYQETQRPRYKYILGNSSAAPPPPPLLLLPGLGGGGGGGGGRAPLPRGRGEGPGASAVVGGEGPPPASGGGGGGGGGGVRVCPACSLIQARPDGTHCEMCDAALPAAAAAAAAAARGNGTMGPLRGRGQLYTRVHTEQLRDPEPIQAEKWMYISGQNGHEAVKLAETSGYWNYVVRQSIMDKHMWNQWERESIHMAWVWVQQAMRKSLRDRLHTGKINRNTALGEQDVPMKQKPTIRAINKMLSKNWQLLHECLALEFGLQAEALSWDARPALRGGLKDEEDEDSSKFDILIVLETFISIWEAFDDWVNFWDDYFSSLDDQIAFEKNNKNPAEDENLASVPPGLRNTALLAFRNRFLLRRHVLDSLSKLMGKLSQGEQGCVDWQQYSTTDMFTNEELLDDEVLRFSVANESQRHRSVDPPAVVAAAKPGGAGAPTAPSAVSSAAAAAALLAKLGLLATELDVGDDAGPGGGGGGGGAGGWGARGGAGGWALGTRARLRRRVLVPLRVWCENASIQSSSSLSSGSNAKKNPGDKTGSVHYGLQDDFSTMQHHLAREIHVNSEEDDHHYHPDMYMDIGKPSPHRHKRSEWERFKKDFFK